MVGHGKVIVKLSDTQLKKLKTSIKKIKQEQLWE